MLTATKRPRPRGVSFSPPPALLQRVLVATMLPMVLFAPEVTPSDRYAESLADGARLLLSWAYFCRGQQLGRR